MPLHVFRYAGERVTARLSKASGKQNVEDEELQRKGCVVFHS